MTLNTPRPWKMLLPLAAVLALAALWTVYWFIAQGMARAEFAKSRDELSARGLDLACVSESWGGFPFRFEYVCQAPRLAEHGNGRLASGQLQVVALAYKPWHLIALLHGPTRATPSGISPVDVIHEIASASLVVHSTQGGTAIMEIPSLEIPGLVAARKLLFSARTSSLQQYDYAASLESISLTLPDMAPLVLDSVAAQGTVTQDGALVIETATARTGTLELSAKGQLTLDGERRPRGQIVLQTNDGPRLLRIIADTFRMTEQQRAVYSALLTVTGNQLTLTANDGELYAGPLKIGDLEALP